MARLAVFVALFFGLFSALSAASPVSGRQDDILVARQNAPEPPNGVIELHHNPETASWYLMVALNPDNYDHTYGTKVILGQHNPLSIVTLFFDVTSTQLSGSTETDYTIHSKPVAFEHHIVDPLTEVRIFNAKPQYYPEGQQIFFSIDINGVSAGQVGGGPAYPGGPYTVNATDFSADLNKPISITGIFTQ